MMKRRSQRGATLIVVLVILLLIMIIGTLAIRQSLVSLNIATNSQAQQLMLESSDAAIVKVEDPIFFNFNRTGNGIFGYALDKSRKGKEIVFALKEHNLIFLIILR
jgi:type II secretory pathway component PulK